MIGQEEEVGGGEKSQNTRPPPARPGSARLGPVAPPGAPFSVCLSPWPDSGTAPVWEEPSKVSPLLPPAAQQHHHHHPALSPAPPALRSLDPLGFGVVFFLIESAGLFLFVRSL